MKPEPSSKIRYERTMKQQAVKSRRSWQNMVSKCIHRQRTRYCQQIRDANKVKRLEFAQRVLETGDTFDNIIFTDECSISLEQFHRTCYRKVGEPAKRKPKPKYPLKLHVWAGISRHGGAKICIFEGIMAADLYIDILRTHLLPFINEKLQSHRFMQDNDPKHPSRVAKAFFEEQSQLDFNFCCIFGGTRVENNFQL